MSAPKFDTGHFRFVNFAGNELTLRATSASGTDPNPTTMLVPAGLQAAVMGITKFQPMTVQYDTNAAGRLVYIEHASPR
ncbi:MAG: hypothetical protein GC131_01390 [Alphaproteobacteria bacterium]|nr:hypothetical protein [Alphaproteobacteria bacterium]